MHCSYYSKGACAANTWRFILLEGASYGYVTRRIAAVAVMLFFSYLIDYRYSFPSSISNILEISPQECISKYFSYSHTTILTSKSKAADQPLRCERIERWKGSYAARLREDLLNPDIALHSIINKKLCINPTVSLEAAVSHLLSLCPCSSRPRLCVPTH